MMRSGLKSIPAYNCCGQGGQPELAFPALASHSYMQAADRKTNTFFTFRRFFHYFLPPFHALRNIFFRFVTTLSYDFNVHLMFLS